MVSIIWNLLKFNGLAFGCAYCSICREALKMWKKLSWNWKILFDFNTWWDKTRRLFWSFFLVMEQVSYHFTCCVCGMWSWQIWLFDTFKKHIMHFYYFRTSSSFLYLIKLSKIDWFGKGRKMVNIRLRVLTSYV
jgi:hypothetical protein